MTRTNSTIKIRCKCLLCKSDPEKAKAPTLGCQGYFYAHAPESVKAIVGTKKKLAQRNHNKRVAIGRKLHIEQKKVNQQTEGTGEWALKLFYSAAAFELESNPHCQNCGAFIPSHYYRSSTAHVLPKRKEYGFPSVSAHPKNRLFLGSNCGCHFKYDRSWDDASNMAVWPLAVERFKEIYPYIAPEELKNLPNVLLATLLPAEHSMACQHPNNQNSKYDEGNDTNNLGVNRGDVLTKEVQHQVKNCQDNKNYKQIS